MLLNKLLNYFKKKMYLRKKNIFIIITTFFNLLILNKSYSLSNINKNYIKIPFIIPSPDLNTILNSQSFLKNFLERKLILNISLGTQNINGIIDQYESCLKFISDDEKEENDNYNSLNKYSPKDSTTFNIRTEIKYITYGDDELMAIGSDFFLFEGYNNNNLNKYNLSFLFIKTTEKSDINYNLIKNKKYIAKVGLQLYNRDLHFEEKYPQFTYDTKKIANLSKYLLSFEFTDANKGNLIYGNELFIYNKKKYHESQYIGSYCSRYHQIFFNRVYLYNEKNNITEGTYASFDYNLGLIIGTNKYKEKIDIKFFDELKRNNNICSEEKIIFNKTYNFSIYSCKENEFKNKIKTFPSLIFNSIGFEYNFELNYDDLFIILGWIL